MYGGSGFQRVERSGKKAEFIAFLAAIFGSADGFDDFFVALNEADETEADFETGSLSRFAAFHDAGDACNGNARLLAEIELQVNEGFECEGGADSDADSGAAEVDCLADGPSGFFGAGLEEGDDDAAVYEEPRSAAAVGIFPARFGKSQVDELADGLYLLHSRPAVAGLSLYAEEHEDAGPDEDEAPVSLDDEAERAHFLHDGGRVFDGLGAGPGYGDFISDLKEFFVHTDSPLVSLACEGVFWMRR